jgi:glycosyltransferase involved in cell wall biosynthesis
MEEKIYPKVLIIGRSLNKKSGGGITLCNLFTGWPKKKLAVAASDNLRSGFDTSICDQFYQLGYNSKLHPFPLNIFLPKIQCGIIIQENENNKINSNTRSITPGKYKRTYNLISAFLKFVGIYNVLYKLKITPEFKDWVSSYNPDIIYSQLSTLELIRFVSNVHELLDKPVVVHIMDDWPKSINVNGLLFFYWKKVIDKEFRKLLDKSSVLLSICESMSAEYRIRYNKKFIPFNNPVVINNWLPYSKKQWETDGVFRILYTGRVGNANGKAILFMAKVIDEMNRSENRMILDIYTPDTDTKKASDLRKLRGISIINTVKYEKIPSLLASYDLLFLPLDFDSYGIRFAQFSMPTKSPEYMISGTPILVFADKKTALAKYATEGKWAYTVTENNKAVLKQALLELNSNILLRRNLAERAMSMAVQNDDAIKIRENFRKILSVNISASMEPDLRKVSI